MLPDAQPPSANATPFGSPEGALQKHSVACSQHSARSCREISGATRPPCRRWQSASSALHSSSPAVSAVAQPRAAASAIAHDSTQE